MRLSFLRTTALCIALGIITSTASADLTNTVDRGFYRDNGSHNPGVDSYFTGKNIVGTFRSFFVFDLSGITQQIGSATLIAFNGINGYGGDATEDYALFDVTTSIASLTGGTGGVAAFNDLGTGTSFGDVTVSSADNNSDISIVLNAAGLAALNANLGGQLAIGGAITTITGNNSQFFFGNTGGGHPSDGDTRLEFTPIPAPGAATLGLLGLGAVAFKRRRG